MAIACREVETRLALSSPEGHGFVVRRLEKCVLSMAARGCIRWRYPRVPAALARQQLVGIAATRTYSAPVSRNVGSRQLSCQYPPRRIQSMQFGGLLSIFLIRGDKGLGESHVELVALAVALGQRLPSCTTTLSHVIRYYNWHS